MACKNAALALGLWGILCCAAFSSKALAVEADVPFQAGEKLTYAIRWGLIPVGTGTLWVRDTLDFEGKKAYHISIEGHSNAFLSAFYEVDDFVQTFWDKQKLCSLAFQKIQNEGHYHTNDVYLFDQDRQKAVSYGRKRGRRQYAVPPSVQDALSCLYYYRSRGLGITDSMSMDVFQDRKNYKVRVRTEAKEKIKVKGMGKVSTICVEPQAAREGMFFRKGQMWIWFTDDQEKIPVQVKVRASIFGKVTAELQSVEQELDPEPTASAGEIFKMRARENAEGKNAR